MAQPEELLTTRDAAAYLKMNEQTLRLYARQQRIPAVNVGRRWLIRRTALDAWIDSHQSPQRGVIWCYAVQPLIALPSEA